jgi:hypothetical protein
MARISLDVTNYLVDGQLPANVMCEWLDGLDVTVGASRNEFGCAITDFHGTLTNLQALINRVETDLGLTDELVEQLNRDFG